MASLTDYTIDHAELDWAGLLASWAWLLPRALTVWIVNRFGDIFLVVEDGAVHRLDLSSGSLERMADDREDFCRRIDEGDNAADWLLIPLVDRLVAAGLTPGVGECYGYIQLPVLGGTYTAQNIRVVPIASHYKALGPIHEKLRNVPDGAHVAFELSE
jgi:hypothetical protein